MASDSGKPPDPRDSSAAEQPSTADACDDATASPEAREASARALRLAAIRALVDSGAYDSDELLDEAMNRMRNALENDTSAD